MRGGNEGTQSGCRSLLFPSPLPWWPLLFLPAPGTARTLVSAVDGPGCGKNHRGPTHTALCSRIRPRSTGGQRCPGLSRVAPELLLP